MPQYRYIPLYNEAMLVNSAARSLVSISSTIKLKRCIKDSTPWDFGFNDSTIIKTIADVALVKTIVDVALVKTIKQQLKASNLHLAFPMVFSDGV